MNKKPFNLERALAGYPVVTGGNLAVTQLKLFKNLNSPYNLYGVVEGSDVWRWAENGKYSLACDGVDLDLFMASVKKEGWINIFSKGNSTFYAAFCSNIFKTKAEAMNGNEGRDNYLETIRIEWEE